MAKIGVQIILSGFIFGIDDAGYEKLSRSSNYRWPAQNRIQHRVAHQFVGEGNEAISINGYIHPEMGVGMYKLDDLRALAAGGQPHIVVTMHGKIFGKFVIVSVKDDFSGLLDDGKARRVDFVVELKRYGEDGA